MSDALQSALTALQSQMGEKRPDFSARFDMGEDGALRIDAEGAHIDDGGEADCTLIASMETFQGMFEGDVNPTSAFMTGKLKVDGDMSVAMKLASLLG